jgi:hypothetical protein
MPRIFAYLLLLLPVALPCAAAQAFELPGWQQLVFEQRSFWVTARGVVTLREQESGGETAGAPQVLQLEINNYIGSNSEQIAITLRADNGATVERWRLSRGRDQRLKTHLYREQSIVRKRREPDAEDPGVAPAEWDLSSRMELPLPEPALQDKIIISPHSLLALLPTFVAEPARAGDYLVHTDLNFYALEVTLGPESGAVRSALQIDGAAVNGRRDCQRLTIATRALDSNPEKNDLELMGMTGTIEVFVDQVTGLPLLLRGDAPRIGRAELKLIQADTRSGNAPLLSRIAPRP